MLSWLISLVKPNSLDSVLGKTKTLKVCGVRFKIKKIDAFDFIEGYKVMLQTYDTPKFNSTQEKAKPNDKKIKEHLAHVICSAVVEPKISLKKEEGSFYVYDLFVNMTLVNKLYEDIIEYTYGKKKVLNS